MQGSQSVPWDRMQCRSIVDRLKDGEPPPLEAMDFLSIGCEDHLERARTGLEKAAAGSYDIMILEGKYGIGKSHFLSRVEVLAQQHDFAVRRVEIGNGVHFNDPDGICRQVLNGDRKPGWRYYWRGDRLRKFIGELKALAEMQVQRGHRGLALLFDEMENTFYLNRFPSRAKAYRFMGALFEGHDEGGDGYVLELSTMLVIMAITPGTLEQASEDGWWSSYRNPALLWTIPERRTIEPLEHRQALELSRRIRAIHSVGLDWEASDCVPDAELERLCWEWYLSGATRDEAQLVKQVIGVLELSEQNR